MTFSRSILLLVLTGLIANAQPPLPAVPIPPTLPGIPPLDGGAANALPQSVLPPIKPGIPLGDNQITEDIIEPKLSGNALAALYRRYTGRRVIVSNAASTAEFSFVQEASPKDPLTFADAAELLKKAAIIENFVFVQHPNDPKLDVLTIATGGIRPPGVGLDIYKDEDALPEGDAVISYVMTLSYIKPAEAVNTFTQIIGQFGAFGSIAAVPNASAIVITENTSLIRKLIDLKKEIDKPSSQVSSRFVKVQYADVTEIADILTTLLTAQSSAQTTAGVQRATPAPAAGAPPGVPQIPGQPGGGGSGEENPPQIVPEPRTNRIFIMGRPVDILFVEGLIREFDIPTSEKTFMRRKLRFLTVSDFLPIAGDALTRAFSSTGDSGGSGGAAGGAAGAGQGAGRAQSNGRNQSTGGRNSNGSRGSSGNNSFGGGNSSFGGGGSGGGFGGSSGGGGLGGGGLDDPSVSSAPESLLVGRTLLVADNITNSVVAQGPPTALEIIERLLDQIDVKPDQVMISTVIGQLTLGEGFETGLDYIYRGGDSVARGGGGLFPALPILRNLVEAIPGTPGRPATPGIPQIGEKDQPGYVPAVPGTPATPGTPGVPAEPNSFDPGSLASASGLRAYGQIGDLGIFLKALQTKSDFTVLSRPSIFTSNNQKGTISSGERIAIPTGSTNFGGNNNSSTQIQYQDVVLKLEVIPLVNDNKQITMQIALLNDEQNGTQTIAGGGGNGGDLTVPRISTREILTTATVPNNQTIVLGGLIVNKDSQSKSGIPILSDIPYLGRLFSSVEDITNRSELMVFIQPSIVNSERTLDDVQSAMDNRYKVSPKVRTFADGPGVLPAVDEIPRVETGGKNSSRKAIEVESAPQKTTRKSSFPVYRK